MTSQTNRVGQGVGAGAGVGNTGSTPQWKTQGGYTTKPRSPGYALGAFAGDPLGYLKDSGKKALSPFEQMVQGISEGYKAASGGEFTAPQPESGAFSDGMPRGDLESGAAMAGAAKKKGW